MTLPQRPRLALLGGFSLQLGSEIVNLSPHLQRPLALLSLSDAPLARHYVAGALWGDSTERHALASLRSALWKLRDNGLELIEHVGDSLRLSGQVDVDVRRATHLARDLMRGCFEEKALGLLEPPLLSELLPGWYDDWVLVERERYRQLSLHAFELLCEHLTEQSRFGPAVLAGLAAVSREPLRESGYRALMKAYLAEGNVCEAMRSYDQYTLIAARELGIGPSPQMRALLDRVAQHREPVVAPIHRVLTPW
jgi:DNA-binding SARP family transcriptional activator